MLETSWYTVGQHQKGLGSCWRQVDIQWANIGLKEAHNRTYHLRKSKKNLEPNFQLDTFSKVMQYWNK
ncbi:hypothetical protein CHS0354_028951 [Potamilus streckersoni]|uniref:Uncharacterized protein n=1 Tax=Potamilus streckersoni TaxID=2493646 RepID=A0AAE0SBZ2_9BIVA|nr:hypothetical protein CHS0354_028951 [Potamilus streckersoni]